MPLDSPQQGLRFEQAPPLLIPAVFFVTAPLAVVAAGAWLITTGTHTLQSHWLPATLGLTHLSTLGFLAMVMLGALYQMAPVVANAPVPRVRIAHLVHGVLAIGCLRLVLGLSGLWPGMVYPSFALVGVALLLFVVNLGLALARSPTRGATVASMRVALLSLLLAAGLGVVMAQGLANGSMALERSLWLRVHLTLAVIGWVGGMISGISWRVIPMFYLAPPIGVFWQRVVLILITSGIMGSLAMLFLARMGVDWLPWSLQDTAALAALPAALSVWVLHPFLILASLRHRRRKRLDGSALFWVVGLAVAPLVALAVLAAQGSGGARWTILAGWLAIWGWAGMIIQGMLSRIIPFLVWFHRFAPLVGKVSVPSMRALLPESWIRIGFALHAGSLLVGALAIVAQQAWLARLTGVLLLTTAVYMWRWMARVLARKPAPALVDSA